MPPRICPEKRKDNIEAYENMHTLLRVERRLLNELRNATGLKQKLAVEVAIKEFLSKQ